MIASSTNAPALAAGTTASRRHRLVRTYLTEAKLEIVKMLRLPAYSIPTILFPVMFYTLFGLSFGGDLSNGMSMATYLLATYGAFGVIGASLFGFGVGVAVERGQGWMLLKRASPMPPGAYFAAKLVLSLLFGAVIIALLFALGAAFGGVSLPMTSWLSLFAVLVMGAVPFCALGLVIGYFAGPNSAVAVVNLLYLPMAFASGLWIPIQGLPPFFRSLAPWLPPFHYSQLALKQIGADLGHSVSAHVLYLVIFTVACLVLAGIGYRRDKGRTYG